MSRYIMLINYTDQGIRNIKSSPKRAEAARFLAKSCGAELKDLYLTLGLYDVVLMVEAVDDEAVAKFNDAGIPCGPVYTAEDVFNDPHVAARRVLMPVPDPDVGAYRFARTPPHLSANPELPANPPPNLGQHTREILQGLLGYDAENVDGLAADGVVQLG